MGLKHSATGVKKRNLLTLSYSCREFLKTAFLDAAALAWPGFTQALHSLPGSATAASTTDETIAIMKKVCDWQLKERRRHRNNAWRSHLVTHVQLGPMPHRNDHWTTATFYAGVMATYHATQDEKYFKAALKMAEENGWQPGPRLRHADDHCVGQTYLELYLSRKDSKMIAPIRATFDQIMAEPRPGRTDWWWCDSLFMAPPVLARLSAATGEMTYLDFMNRMWWDATEFLYDPEERLYFRDKNFKIGKDGSGRREKNGQKIFWSRGNGWVMGGIVRVLQYMPENYPDREKYIHLLGEMAQKIAALQGQDGLWRAGLLAPESYPAPETSGSGLFCYALAWGVNQGILEKEKYLPVVENAWQGLVGAVHQSGKLGWVQQVGSKPKSVSRYDTEVYGVGAFLLAGSEIVKLSGGEKGDHYA